LNRRLFAILFASLVLGVTLLIQRSMITYYAYRCSELDQQKEKLHKKLHSLEVEIRMACRNDTLYQYWAERRDEFVFQLPEPDTTPLVDAPKPEFTTFTSMRKAN
jgi:hypothetical protein